MKRFFYAFLCLSALTIFAPTDDVRGNSIFTPESYRGVSLEDLSRFEANTPTLGRLSEEILKYLSTQPDLKMSQILSSTFAGFDGYTTQDDVLVDLFARDRSFSRNSRSKKPGVGLLRIAIQHRGHEVLGHRIVFQREYVDMSPAVKVSLGDRLALITDPITGFRRIFPLGVGSVDDVRFKGIRTLMTPTTKHGRLLKNAAIAKRKKPSYFKNKPFVRLAVPKESGPITETTRYRWTDIGFHIWQESGFMRGFLSHGCIRMRDEDLDEMYILVSQARPDYLPVEIQVEVIAGASHPYPFLSDMYNRIYNAGTRAQPKATKVLDKKHNVKLTKTETVRQRIKRKGEWIENPEFELPEIHELTGINIDPVPVGPMPPEPEAK